MLISSFLFLFLDSTKVTLHESQLKKANLSYTGALGSPLVQPFFLKQTILASFRQLLEERSGCSANKL